MKIFITNDWNRKEYQPWNKNGTIKNLHILSMWEEGKEKVLDLKNWVKK